MQTAKMMSADPLTIRPAEDAIRAYRGSGAWRQESMVDDLRRWAAATPDRPALVADRADSGVRVITWRELRDSVERFAAGLAALGVGRRDVVAMQLPNWWEAAAITLACCRLGAVLAPMMTTIRGRELERMLARVGARVMITTGVWDEHDHAAMLASLAPRLPGLRHRVILHGSPSGAEIDFDDHFGRIEHPSPGAPVSDPDAVSQILFTSGTTGEPKAVMRTQNTLFAQVLPWKQASGRPVRRSYTPQSVMHGAALGTLTEALAAGAMLLMTDTWRPARAAALLAEHDIEQVVIVPPFLDDLLTAVRDRDVPLPALRRVLSIGSAISPDLVDRTAAVLELPVQVAWGMTEGGMLITGSDDPADWAARSVGRPGPGSEFMLRPGTPGGEIDEHRPGRLFMRGASVGLAVQGRDTGELRLIAHHDDGWYDTGDLALPDGRGGFRLAGRAADRIGGAFMIPVADVEDALRSHPAITDVAIVGHRGGEEGCAIVVATTAIDLAAIRRHLGAAGMTEWYWPTRVEQADALPRNAMGKVEKARLRAWLEDKSRGD